MELPVSEKQNKPQGVGMNVCKSTLLKGDRQLPLVGPHFDTYPFAAQIVTPGFPIRKGSSLAGSTGDSLNQQPGD